VDELHRRLVKNIRDRAKRADIAITHLPDRAGVSRSNFWEVMAGRAVPKLDWVGKVAAALDVDAVDLLARERHGR
jgi:hypothetical protein